MPLHLKQNDACLPAAASGIGSVTASSADAHLAEFIYQSTRYVQCHIRLIMCDVYSHADAYLRVQQLQDRAA